MFPPPPPPNYTQNQQPHSQPSIGNSGGFNKQQPQQGFQPPPPGNAQRGFQPPPPGNAQRGFQTLPPGNAQRGFQPLPPGNVQQGFQPAPAVSSQQRFQPPPPGNAQQGFQPPPPGSSQQQFQPGNFRPPNATPGSINRFGGSGGSFAPPSKPNTSSDISNVQQTMSNMSIGPPPPKGFPNSQPTPPVGFSPPAHQLQSGVNSAYGVNPPPPPQMQQQQQQIPPGNSQGSSPFYSQPPSKARVQQFSGPTSNKPQPTNSIAYHENVDLSIQVPSRLMRFTTSKIPQTKSIALASKLPFGSILRPLAPAGPGEEDVSVIVPGASGIIRCKRCRTYINAFVSWVEQGRRWRCNICGQMNECPSSYFCHVDEHNQRRDRMTRPELHQSVVEFVAPSEYMVRPPQIPAYFFVIDVSATAVQSGMLSNLANAIRKSLDDLPGSPRTQIGFLTFDHSVHYYCLKAGMSTPQMMVVADLKELFVPVPDDLLVNLKESRDVVESFLDNLPTMFANTQVTEACLGPALKAAFTVTKHIGGKMLVFQSVLPSLGDGMCKPRENFRLMGTPEEIKLLKPGTNWYKETALEFSRAQISVEMFLFPFQYIDTASLVELPHATSGRLRTYAAFDSAVDGPKFESDLHHALTRQPIAFEAVMRIRCTRGMKINNFYGNFLIRGTDLLALPNCNADSVFAFDLAHDEQNLISSSVVTVQGALLYTSSQGERRIRVMTQAVPMTALVKDLIASLDIEVMCNLIAKQAITIARKSSLVNARVVLQKICMDIIRASKEGDRMKPGGYGAVPPPPATEDNAKDLEESLNLLPLYTLSLIKNVVFRGGTDVHPDERVQFMQTVWNMWVTESNYFFYPRMFTIKDMDPAVGLPYEGEDDDADDIYAGNDKIVLPKVVSLSAGNLSSDGVYLLDSSVDLYMWIGRNISPDTSNALFGLDSLQSIESSSQVKLLSEGNNLVERIQSIVHALRDAQGTYPKVTIVLEGDSVREQRFFWHLVEDRASFHGGTYSYPEFMDLVSRAGAAPSHGGMMPPTGAPSGGIMPSTSRGMMAPPPPAGPAPSQGSYGMQTQPIPQGHVSNPPSSAPYAPPPPGNYSMPSGPPRIQQPPSTNPQQPSYGAPPPPPMNSQQGMMPPPPRTSYAAPPPPRGPPSNSSTGYGMPPPNGPPIRS